VLQAVSSRRAIRSTFAAMRRRSESPVPSRRRSPIPNVSAVLVLHVPQPITGATDAARAVAAVAARASKPVLGAWLGAVDRREVAAALDAGGVANFYTPENAVEAFSFLGRLPPPSGVAARSPSVAARAAGADLDAINHLRIDAGTARRTFLTEMESHALLSAFGLPVPPAQTTDTLAEATAAARRLGFPVTLRLAGDESSLQEPSSPAASVRVRDSRMLARAWAAMHDAGTANGKRGAVIVAKEQILEPVAGIAVGLCTDAIFGRVITFGTECAGGGADVAVLLPPLNLRLARDHLLAMPTHGPARNAHATGGGGRRLGAGPGAGVGARVRGAVGANARASSGESRDGRCGDRACALPDRSGLHAGIAALWPHGDPPVSR
jgi:hypothetical protein